MRQTPGHARPSESRSILTALFPEGVITPVLLIALMAIAGKCIDSSDWPLVIIPIVAVAIGATVFGSLMSKVAIDDALAHAVSLIVAMVAVGGLVIVNADSLSPGLRARTRELGSLAVDWYLGRPVPDETESYLVSFLMGLMVWLVGHLAAWALFRRGWVFLALVLPGFLILVNLATTDATEDRWLAAYVGIAVVLLARMSLHARQREWRRHGLGGPTGLAGRFVVIGVVIAILATSFGWQSPDAMSQRALQPLMDDLGERAESLQQSASDWVDRVASTGDGTSSEGGSFTNFGDSFSIGGPLNLGDAGQVVVFADDAPYLSAQHYDSYSGRGWTSTTDDTFNPVGPDGRTYAPEMTFAPNQPVPLSDQVTTDRGVKTVEVLPLVPLGDHMLTVNTYQASDVQNSVRMSWIQFDGEVFAVADGSIQQVPRDVAHVVQLLSEADLAGEQGATGPQATDPNDQAAIDDELNQLSRRFLTVTWTAGADGDLASVTITGQVPVYDDVEAVYFRDDERGDEQYTLLARPTLATPDSLRSASIAYPDWVMDRYLQLPDTISPRTLGLVEQIVAGLDNPYDQAKAIEEFLRSTIAYDESVTEPPEGADIVDFLLFERQRGYCEYTATAMTAMLRATGIPARVAVGFYPGDYDQSVGGYLYLQRNAHAWTEVYFPGYGWIPFEPTSSQPVIDEGEGISEDDPDVSEPLPTEEPLVPTSPVDEATPAIAEPPSDRQDAPMPATVGNDGGSGWLVWALGGTAILGAACAVAWLAWVLPLRNLSPASAFYARIRRVGGWFGIRPRPEETPGEYARAFAERLPGAREPVWRIVKTYELEAYGPGRDGNGPLGAARDAWMGIRRHLPGWFMRRTRRNRADGGS